MHVLPVPFSYPKTCLSREQFGGSEEQNVLQFYLIHQGKILENPGLCQKMANVKIRNSNVLPMIGMASEMIFTNLTGQISIDKLTLLNLQMMRLKGLL